LSIRDVPYKQDVGREKTQSGAEQMPEEFFTKTKGLRGRRDFRGPFIEASCEEEDGSDTASDAGEERAEVERSEEDGDGFASFFLP
jgi:hypothetical protein